MSIEGEINEIISKHTELKLTSKLEHIKSSSKVQTSKFTAQLKLIQTSKLSKLPKNLKSDLDIPIPLDVEIHILSEGENRDGIILDSELVNSISRWEGISIIPYHDMDDMSDISTYNIADDCGVVDHAEIKVKNGKKFAVARAQITNRNVAYQMYLREQKGKPIQVSAEYRWTKDYDLNGKVLQTNIKPGIISLVDKGHIKGNSIKIASAF